jgi:hypothetical protein
MLKEILKGVAIVPLAGIGVGVGIFIGIKTLLILTSIFGL